MEGDMRAIPAALRQKILDLYGRNRSTREIADVLGFSVAAVRRVRQQFQERGSLEPQTHLCGRKSLLTPERKVLLEQLLARKPDATLAELGSQLDRSFGTSTVDLWLRKLGWNYKKNAARHGAKPSGRRGKAKPLA